MIENFNGSWFLMIEEFDWSFLIERECVYPVAHLIDAFHSGSKKLMDVTFVQYLFRDFAIFIWVYNTALLIA